MSQKSEQITPTAEGLAASAQAARAARGLPPVHLWNPPFCGDLDMRIAADGTWFYLGTPIGRFELVKLFSSILKLEDGKYFLVTPVEKVGITVEDAPFVAVDFTVQHRDQEQSLTFETHVGDRVTASAENPITVQFAQDGEPRPYVHVRAGLTALIDRKSFYRLVDLGTSAVQEGQEMFGLWSGGQFFPMCTMRELEGL